MNLDLTHRRALVLGASRGLGKASAVALARLGAEVVLAARGEDTLKAARRELPAPANGEHAHVVLDMADPAAALEALQAHLGTKGIHILVNNSGGPAPGTILEASPAALEAAFAQHVLSAQRLVQAFVPFMRDEKYGRIINIISTSVKQPIPGLGVSNTIRGAMANWAKTLAAEVAPFGITVNNVLPGSIMTDRLVSVMETRARREGKTREAVEAEMIAEIPAGRIGDPSDLGGAVAFLASPAAAYITGINLPVDGGRIRSL